MEKQNKTKQNKIKPEDGLPLAFELSPAHSSSLGFLSGNILKSNMI